MAPELVKQWAKQIGDKHVGSSAAEFEFMDDEILEFAALVAAHEREECAKVCAQLAAKSPIDDPDRDAIGACEDAIRARRNT